MSPEATITPALFERVLVLLAPLFIDAARGDEALARSAAKGMLANYGARNDEELRFAALNVAFGFGALQALSQAVDKDVSLNQQMRLRGSAISLNRAAYINRTALLRSQKGPAAENAIEEALLPDTINATELLKFARSAMQTTPAGAPMTRQQRRAAERQAEKAKRQMAFQARKAALVGADAG